MPKQANTILSRRSLLGNVGAITLGVGIASGAGVVGAEPDDSGIEAIAYFGEGTHFSQTDETLSADLFDVENPRTTGNGRVAHNELPIGDGKPYVLLYDPDIGRYTQRGAIINFTGDRESELWPIPGRWRAVVREEVQPIPVNEFGWSVTRVDFFKQPGMKYDASSLIVVWDSAVCNYPDSDDIDDVVDHFKEAGTANPGGN